ncbi:phosphinothricin acetyltransferase [Palleronia aestuarii]|uniref:Phosphinothricin acetyltransferase n=1 Tax=Palleronia aestuarii TaxID=568105 RepID=A0A2W7N7X7_9RHOB|nr:GNAT family N-acetyltransferase [Palleronia aestuarii]PZX16241.1 phosphinothricin acetyltransferase [Palleronia aestuarii]
MRVRDSIDADLEAITAIYGREVAGGTATFELDPPELAEMARRRRALVESGFPHLVAEIGGEVAGYASAGPYRPRPAYRHSVEISIYVAERHRGAGVGRRLTASLLDRCTAMGMRQAIAVIGGADNAASLALHRALGFSRAGVLTDVGFKHGAWRDTILMQRALGPGASTPPDVRPR